LKLTVLWCVQDVGYEHGKTMLQGWDKGGLINKLFQEKRQAERKMESHTSPDVVCL